jgi:hypothetical protein
MSYLNNLPNELVEEISLLLPCPDIISLMNSNCSIRNFLQNSENFWKLKFSKDFSSKILFQFVDNISEREKYFATWYLSRYAYLRESEKYIFDKDDRDFEENSDPEEIVIDLAEVSFHRNTEFLTTRKEISLLQNDRKDLLEWKEKYGNYRQSRIERPDRRSIFHFFTVKDYDNKIFELERKICPGSKLYELYSNYLKNLIEFSQYLFLFNDSRISLFLNIPGIRSIKTECFISKLSVFEIEVPIGISLVNCETLVLCRVSSLPSEIWSMKNITRLVLSKIEWLDSIEGIGNLQFCETLRLSELPNLKTIPKDFPNLSLFKLNLESLEIEFGLENFKQFLLKYPTSSFVSTTNFSETVQNYLSYDFEMTLVSTNLKNFVEEILDVDN